MRIYNSQNSQISIPLTATEKIIVPAHGTSLSFMPNPRILSLIVTSFDYSDIALIVSGPIEMTMCSETPCCSGFVVSSVEEAIERFTTPTTASMKCAAKVIDPINEAKKTEKKAEEPCSTNDEEQPAAEVAEEVKTEEAPQEVPQAQAEKPVAEEAPEGQEEDAPQKKEAPKRRRSSKKK